MRLLPRRHIWSPHVARPGYGGEYCVNCGAIKEYPYPIIGSRFCKSNPTTKGDK